MSRQAEAERNDRALLQAAREVLAVDGAHASVAAIAARAGVGIGSLYRRYRSKTELFQHLCEVALDEWADLAEHGFTLDPWEGLEFYITHAIRFGSLAPIAGTVPVSEAMAAKNVKADKAFAALVGRARKAGVLRPDVTDVDVSLLVEQLSKSPLIEQLQQQGRTDLLAAAYNAQQRLVAIALDGLRGGSELPGSPPDSSLFTERWA